MIIRAFSFRKLIWFHAGWMVFTYLIVLTGMGLGVWMAVVSDQLDAYHAIIGLVVVGALLLQPVTGLVHHLLYKRRGAPNVATYPHMWWGRAVTTLGIINGGLGLMLSGDGPRGAWIGYGVGAAIMWCLWIGVIIVSSLKTRGMRQGETGAKIFATDSEKVNDSSTEFMREAGQHNTSRT